MRKLETKEKIGNIVIVFMAIFTMAIIWMASKANQSQLLENLDYDVRINENGDAEVIETWDIDINLTNTLFKTFTLDDTRYSEIYDVQVADITDGTYKPLTEIYTEMYHVTTGCYYGLQTDPDSFEIAWGTGMEHSSGRKKYQVSYTIRDAVTDYIDCQEFYWQFLAKGENNIPARKVTGRVTLPYDVQEIDNLKVWGHGPLNGEIDKVNNHQVEFSVEDLTPGQMLEIRVATTDRIFDCSKSEKMTKYQTIQSIIDEESVWANEANETADEGKNTLIVFAVIYAIIIVIYVCNILGLRKYKNAEIKKMKRIEYFRDIPREETATPTEAAYMYKFEKRRLEDKEVQQNAVAATILDLCLKRKITLRNDGRSRVYITVIGGPEGLKDDEKEVYTMLNKIGNGQEFEVGALIEYARDRYYQYSNGIANMVNSARNSLYNLQLIDKYNEKKYKKCKNAEGKYNFLYYTGLYALIAVLLAQIPFFKTAYDLAFGLGASTSALVFMIILLPLICLLLYKYKLQASISNKIAVLTDAGLEEKAQWHGLLRYMQNFSKFDEKRVPDLILWEKYLVYATALGIADNVIKELKATYPEVFIREYWDEAHVGEEHPVMDFCMNPSYYYPLESRMSPISSVSDWTDKAYKASQTEIARHSSSSRKRSVAVASLVAAVGGGRSVVGMGGR